MPRVPAPGRAALLMIAAAALSLFALPARSQKPGEKKPDKEEKKGPPTSITGKADRRFAPVESAMLEVIEKGKVPGGALAVAKDGELIYSRGFGLADRELKAPVKPESLWRVSSISKPITATAVLQLVERGKFKLDDPVMTVLGLRPPARGFDKRWKDVTIRHLLEHQGGWNRKVSDDPLYSSTEIVKEMGVRFSPATPALTIAYMLRKDLDFDPGTRTAYSNFGYLLLGRVVEKFHARGYEDYVKENVFKPLGLTRPRLGRTLLAWRAPGEVRYYSEVQGRGIVPPLAGRLVSGPYGLFSLETMDSCSGWLASAEDLVRFACAFLDAKKCKVLKEETVKDMFARPKGEKGPTYHSKGWLVRPLEKSDRLTFWHDASLEGSSGMLVHRADGITFAVFFNTREKLKLEKGEDGEPAELMEAYLHRALPVVLRR